MTEPVIPDEAVEAVARAMTIHPLGFDGLSDMGRDLAMRDARDAIRAAAPAILAANQPRRTPPPCGLGGAHLLDVGHAISQALGGTSWSWTWRPDPSRDLIRIEDSRLPVTDRVPAAGAPPSRYDGVAVLQRVPEDVANTHPGAVPGWSWAGDTEPLRDRTGQPLGCDATPEQVADAVLAETETTR